MPDPREEDDIFESAVTPDDPGPTDKEVAVPNAHADQLVSSMISSLQREGGGPAARRYVPTQADEAKPSRQAPGQQPDHPMPSDMQGVLAELREERRARQDLAREIQELRQPRQPETPFNQRVFEDPDNAIDGRVRQYVDPIAQQLQTFKTDMDFRLTRQTYGDEFDTAYQAWFQQVGDQSRPDPQTYFSIMNAQSPGEALMEWYDSQQIRAEKQRGESLKAFKARIEREALERHGIAVEADEAPRGRANGNGRTPERADNGQFVPRHEVRLPTATSRMGHSSRSAAYSPEDGSDEAIFDFGRARPSRG